MRRIAPLFIVMMFLFSCGNGEDEINKEFSKKGTIELMKEIEKDKYRPPKHGNLTDKQVEMYLAVKKEDLVYARQAAENLKKKSQKIEEGEKQNKKPGLGDYMTALKAIGDVADFVTSDLRAAKKLGYNTKEYLWVKEVIIKTKLAEQSEKAMKSAGKMYADMLERLKDRRDSATSEEQREMYDQQIKAISKSVDEMKEGQPLDEDITEHNKILLAKYKDEIVGIDTEIRKWQMLEHEKKN